MEGTGKKVEVERKKETEGKRKTDSFLRAGAIYKGTKMVPKKNIFASIS